MKLLRYTAAFAALALTATPALAAPVGPSQNATATARIVKPLTLTWVQDLDLGTILLSGAGAWAGAVVGVSQAGVLSCANANVTCSGAVQQARYNVRGTTTRWSPLRDQRHAAQRQQPVQTLLRTSATRLGVHHQLGVPGNDSPWRFDHGCVDHREGVYSGTFNPPSI